ncbi:MAG: hypothetical protein ABF868_09950 [Sporolactobacillus sp.]
MEVHIKMNGLSMDVGVSVEIFTYIDRADHKAENLAHEKRCHWDGSEFDECIVAHDGVNGTGELRLKVQPLGHVEKGFKHESVNERSGDVPGMNRIESCWRIDDADIDRPFLNMGVSACSSFAASVQKQQR